MAYRNSRRSKNVKRRKSYRKSKYTTAEKIAFKLGQEERVKASLNSKNTETRVYDAFCKGLQGKQVGRKRKPLFGD